MESPEPDSDELAAEFATIAAVLGSGATVGATFRLIVKAALRTIPACQHAGIFLLEDGTIHTVASSDPLVEHVDRLQIETGEGPCLDAVHSNLPYELSDDLTTDPDYPHFGPQAAKAGIRSALGLRLLGAHRLGGINLYSNLPNAFGVTDRAKAVILATHCTSALGASQTRAEDAATNRDDLRAALASRSTIGQAQGILMEREHLTAAGAFEVLRDASQDLNVKLRDVAQRLVDTGEDPRTPE